MKISIIEILILFSAPDDDIKEPLTMYFNLGLNDKEVTKQLKDHYDTEVYGLRFAFFQV
jgi:hypothetical protein